MDPIEQTLDQQIETLEHEIDELKARLRNKENELSVKKANRFLSQRSGSAIKYYGWRPLDAIRDVLKHNNRVKMTVSELIKALNDGGIAPEEGRALRIDQSIRKNCTPKLKNLTRSGKGWTIQPDELIGLPEWEEEVTPGQHP